MTTHYFETCLYCTKKLKSYRQKKLGYCNNTHLLLAIQTDLLAIKKVLLDREELSVNEQDTFGVNPDLIDKQFNKNANKMYCNSQEGIDIKEYLAQLESDAELKEENNLESNTSFEDCSEIGCSEITPLQCKNCHMYFCQNHMDVLNEVCWECSKEDY